MNLFHNSARSIRTICGIVALFLIIGAVLPAAAQSASAEVGSTDCSIDSRTETVIIEFELDVFYRRNREITVGAWPRTAADENLIESENEDYADVDGYIVTGYVDTLLYDDAHYDAFRLELPLDAFPRGDYDVYIEIEIFDEDGELIDAHDAYDCAFTIGEGSGGDTKGDNNNTSSGCESTIALDCSLDPAEGVETLEGGFSEDPFEVRVDAGGRVAVEPEFAEGSTCKGYVDDAPNFMLDYTDPADMLIFYTEEDSDLTMIVLAPDELWYCDDDTGTDYNPQVTFIDPEEGQYYVWVGTYNDGDSERATLLISNGDSSGGSSGK